MTVHLNRAYEGTVGNRPRENVHCSNLNGRIVVLAEGTTGCGGEEAHVRTRPLVVLTCAPGVPRRHPARPPGPARGASYSSVAASMGTVDREGRPRGRPRPHLRAEQRDGRCRRARQDLDAVRPDQRQERRQGRRAFFGGRRYPDRGRHGRSQGDDGRRRRQGRRRQRRVRIETVGGDIVVRSAGGSVVARTGGGDVTLKKVHGPHVRRHDQLRDHEHGGCRGRPHDERGRRDDHASRQLPRGPRREGVRRGVRQRCDHLAVSRSHGFAPAGRDLGRGKIEWRRSETHDPVEFRHRDDPQGAGRVRRMHSGRIRAASLQSTGHGNGSPHPQRRDRRPVDPQREAIPCHKPRPRPGSGSTNARWRWVLPGPRSSS